MEYCLYLILLLNFVCVEMQVIINGTNTCRVPNTSNLLVLASELNSRYLQKVNSRAIRKENKRYLMLLSNKITPTTIKKSKRYSTPGLKSVAEIKMMVLRTTSRKVLRYNNFLFALIQIAKRITSNCNPFMITIS